MLVNPMSPAAALSIYQQGLQQAACTAKASISAQNQQSRDQLAAELLSFLHARPYGRTLLDCIPEDLLVYIQIVYLPLHAGSVLPDGQVIAAPNTMANVLSHLRQLFKQLGRGETWDYQQQQGNPACAAKLQQWQQGHRKISISAGFRTTGSKEMTEPKMLQLLQHVSDAIFIAPHATAADKAMYDKDGFAFSLLWATGMRGINAASIELADFQLPGQGRDSVTRYLSSTNPEQLQHPGTLLVQPRHLKTCQNNPHSISISPAAGTKLDVWLWLLTAYLLAEHSPAHQAVHGQDFSDIRPQP